jgi:peroxiredoxin Q/BCP
VGTIPACHDKARNTLMVDPPKATKGRRMSKKTRKKSPISRSGKATRAPSKASTKKPAAKTRKTTAKKSAKRVAKKPGNAAAKASHKAPSKKLKSPGPGESTLRAAAESKATATKPKATTPPARKPPARNAALAEGDRAPAFRLPRDGGEAVSPADFSGRKLVLFFYPRADTPGCTKEAIDFTRLADTFAASQTAVLGVSADPIKAQEAFRDKHQLSVPLVSDETHEMLEAYGAWGEKSMYGRTFLGILRTTVLIGADGRIARIWRHVKVDGHADDVLAAAQAL